MTHYEDNVHVSLRQLAEAMIETAELGMVAGWGGSKGVDGQTVEKWVTDYIRCYYDKDFAKDINENL